MAPAIIPACFGLSLDTLWNKPQLLKRTLNHKRNLKAAIGFPYRIRRATLESALGAEAHAGTRPNENNLMLLVLTAPRKGGRHPPFAQEDSPKSSASAAIAN